MTYCCGILVRDGLVMIADPRTGRAIRGIQSAEGKALEAAEIDHDVAFLFGGQIKGERLRLFMIYSAGDFIACTPHAPSRRGPGQLCSQALRERWSAALRAAHNATPRPPYRSPG